MKISNLFNSISDFTNVKVEYVSLLFGTIIVIVIGKIIKYISLKLLNYVQDDSKRYNYNQNIRMAITIVEIIIMLLIWEEYIKSLITLISFLSAAFAIALRDIILNWFCGIYIKISKMFKVEDRIEVNGTKGDVMSLSPLDFEVLEVSNDINGQSTGIVINIPNSMVFSNNVKNYTKGFKYVWNEMKINLDIESDLNTAKEEIYSIVKSINDIQKVPRRTKKQISSINTNYRIYYNNYDPIIYTSIVNNHIELTLRFLINPKKARYIESDIWEKIIELSNNKKIILYKD